MMKAPRYLASVSLAFLLFVGLTTSTIGQKAADKADLDYQVAAVLYTQKAAEYRALCLQANIARLRLDADLDKKNVKKLPKALRKMPRARIGDIDETVVDNSPSQANGILNGKPFNTKDWHAWGELRSAKAVPGAVEFLNYAVSKGVKIFYISNRDEVQKEATIDNLKKAGFYDVDEDNVLLRTTVSGKDERRDSVAAKFRVVLLAGDNLDDFSSIFERKSIVDRFAETDKMKEMWGNRFIVLPNAMYGTWENAIYEYQRLTEPQKAEIRAKALELP